MTQTLESDILDPQILTDTVQGVFRQKTAFMGSLFVSSGAVVVEGTMPEGGPQAIGNDITIPYFGIVGEFVANAEGSSVTPQKLANTSETATISRDSLAFEVSRWAQGKAAVKDQLSDPYDEAARQIMEAATRRMDKRIVDAAIAGSGKLLKNVYNATTARTMDYDLMVESKLLYGDEQDSIVGMVVHSLTHADMLKLKSSTGFPLLVPSQNVGDFDRFAGVPVLVSDRVPLDSSTMAAVVSSGTSPPVVTLAGTPTGPWNLHIDCVTGGLSDGTATFRFSTDDGQTWSATYTITSGGGAFVLDDSVNAAVADIAGNNTADSLVGVNGLTGLTATFANGTYNADNLYESDALLQVRSLILQRGAMAFWYNRAALNLQTDKDILADTDVASMHLYAAAHRYRRRRGGSRPGVVEIIHNVTGF